MRTATPSPTAWGGVKELTGLDASQGEDRERLGLGIKAYRIIAPTLPR